MPPPKTTESESTWMKRRLFIVGSQSRWLEEQHCRKKIDFDERIGQGVLSPLTIVPNLTRLAPLHLAALFGEDQPVRVREHVASALADYRWD
jgi:hypothetical protein